MAFYAILAEKVQETEKEIILVLRQALGPEVEISARPHDGDVRVAIRVGRSRHKLVAHWAGAGWPNLVRPIAERLGARWPRDHVVVARRLSPGAVEWLRERDANWADAAGQARIVTRSGLFVLREVPAPPSRRAPSAFSWSPARTDVAEVLLAEGRVPRLAELADLSGWSVPQVGEALRRFDTEGWTRKEGGERGARARRLLVDAEGLRERWAEHVKVSARARLLGHTLMREPLAYLERELAPALDGIGRYAASGWAGLQLIAPFVSTVPTLHLYVEAQIFDAELPRLLRRLGIREVSEGARIEFWRARPAALHQAKAPRRTSVSVVHPSRLYADLLTLGDRGRVAAEHVRTEFLSAG